MGSGSCSCYAPPMADEDVVVSTDVELTEADFVALVPHLPEFGRRSLLPLAILLLVPASVLVNQGPAVALLLPMILGVAAYAYFVLALRRRWPKRALADLGPGLTSFRFDDFGFSASSSLRQHRLAWSALARYVESPEAFAIYTTPRTLLVVPKRAFGAADVARVSDLLRARVTAKPASPPAGRAVLKRMLLLWLALIIAFLAIWLLLNEEPRPGAPATPAPSAGPAGG